MQMPWLKSSRNCQICRFEDETHIKQLVDTTDRDTDTAIDFAQGLIISLNASENCLVYVSVVESLMSTQICMHVKKCLKSSLFFCLVYMYTDTKIVHQLIVIHLKFTE